jgi:hypothetical protein
MRYVLVAMIWRMLAGALIGGLVIIHVLCGYIGVPSPLNGSQSWVFAFFGVILLAGYLSQIAMMLKSNFSLKTKISGDGAQLEAAVNSGRATPTRASNRGSPLRNS